MGVPKMRQTEVIEWTNVTFPENMAFSTDIRSKTGKSLPTGVASCLHFSIVLCLRETIIGPGARPFAIGKTHLIPSAKNRTWIETSILFFADCLTSSRRTCEPCTYANSGGG
jgi:hypothetical protein